MDQYEAMIKLLLEAVKNEDGTAAGNASANNPANARNRVRTRCRSAYPTVMCIYPGPIWIPCLAVGMS